MQNVLILDDDKSQLIHLSSLLNDHFNIHTANTPLGAYKLINSQKFDAIIVDVHMPIINGFDFIKSIKEDANFNSALFILSSDTSLATKIKALELGVKDFLWPEMCKEEIIPRIKNHLNLPMENVNPETISYNNLKINNTTFSAFFSDKKLNLTLLEYKILNYLVRHATKLVFRDDLKSFVWPQEIVSDKTLNTHLTNLRLKLSETSIEIKSIKGEGVILT
jgi:DNA-binding response OmpR family regulator